MGSVRIRRAGVGDVEALAVQRHRLWADSSVEEHAGELQAVLSGGEPGTLPFVVLVAEDAAGGIAGFVEAGLRSHADGCDPAQPVGYVEGWYVDDRWRRQGVGRLLVQAAEEWARDLGCREMASDTGLENVKSQRAHEALGFQEVERCVLYRKGLWGGDTHSLSTAGQAWMSPGGGWLGLGRIMRG